MFKWLTRKTAHSQAVSDDELIFRLRCIANAEGAPLKKLVDKIDMPDGRTAMEWLEERPNALRQLNEFNLPDWPGE